MFIQIVLGTFMMLVSILGAGLSFWAMEVLLLRYRDWMTLPPHRPKLLLILCVSSVWIMGQVAMGVWLWAALFWSLGLLPTFETTVYFSLASYTTLGFGDVLLPQDWRLLGGMAAANGLLNFGLLTAVLVETLRQVRLSQSDALREQAGHR